MAKAKKVKQLSFMMPDRAGLLSEITAALGAKKVNIGAVCAYGMQNEATFMLTADSIAKAKKALTKLGVVELKDHPCTGDRYYQRHDRGPDLLQPCVCPDRKYRGHGCGGPDLAQDGAQADRLIPQKAASGAAAGLPRFALLFPGSRHRDPGLELRPHCSLGRAGRRHGFQPLV